MKLKPNIQKRADELLGQMTNEEKLSLVCGAGLAIRAIERLGIPEIHFSDASAGLRIMQHNAPWFTKEATAFPCSVLLAATWNPDCAFEYAKAVGEECKAAGIGVLLGPGINIYRTSTNGRNFEYYGEDPKLTSEITAAYVSGLQSTGTVATLKHLVANNCELRRRGSNSVLDERAMHEIYLPGFKAGIEAGAMAVMTGYNLLNGEWVGQNKKLIKGILRDRLGFKGLVMTDWISVFDARKIIESGQNLEMPHGETLMSKKDELIGAPEIDSMAMEILRFGLKCGFYDEGVTDKSLFAKWDEHRQTALKTNHEGIVLLKNSGAFPIIDPAKAGRVLVTGNRAKSSRLGGNGSGMVTGDTGATYLDVCEFLFGRKNVIYSQSPEENQIASADHVFVFPGFNEEGNDFEGECWDRSFTLPEDSLVQACVDNNSKTHVFVVAGGGVSMRWNDKAASVFYLFYGGQTGAQAFADIITGKVNPSGKLPFTIENSFEDSPAYKYDAVTLNPEEYDLKLDNWAFEMKQLFYDEERKVYKTYNVNYGEGIFVGYRWYDKKELAVRYPFGYGKSYTSFKIHGLKANKSENRYQGFITVRVTNTGDMAGAEVVQLYIKDIECSVERPEKELKRFKKVYLQPGETKTVKFQLFAPDYAFYSVDKNEWTSEPGQFEISVGSSSRDIAEHIVVEI